MTAEEAIKRIKPILFNTDMVRGLRDNRKRATRRVVKPQPQGQLVPELPGGCWPGYFAEAGTPRVVRPPYFPGDILYVRETWIKLWYVDTDGYTHFDQPMYYYAADGTPDITLIDENGFELDDQRIRWRPSIHMPREAARIFLRVTDVRAEQLYAITGKQAKAEGFLSRDAFIRAFLTMRPDCTMKSWVWVIEFERISKEEAENHGH